MVAKASMGPRSHERGNGALKSCACSRKFCFNGAAFSRTRKLQIGISVYRGRHASMGPRSHERGNRAILQGACSQGVASMGPRSHERGNGTVKVTPPMLSVGFNGAAFSRTRKPAPTSRGGRCHSPGFNGAAFSRTRKLETTRAHARFIAELQWGRVLTNAETFLSSRSRSTSALASMGPRSHERGNNSTASWSGETRARFNGAAFSRTRKPASRPSGRRSKTVEQIRASMGPRSHERGNMHGRPRLPS